MSSEKEIKILDEIEAIFMRYGMKSVTMDDIARELKISKKTIYQCVSDKKELVCKVIANHIQRSSNAITEIIQKNENAIDETIEIGKYVAQELRQVHPSIHYDMDKYYTDAGELFEKHKKEFIFNMIEANLKKGIEQGLYRENLNTTVIAKLYSEKIDLVFNHIIFPPSKFSFDKVHDEMMLYHLRGITSVKGKKYLDKLIIKENLDI